MVQKKMTNVKPVFYKSADFIAVTFRGKNSILIF